VPAGLHEEIASMTATLDDPGAPLCSTASPAPRIARRRWDTTSPPPRHARGS
jgi:hypothetical protein